MLSNVLTIKMEKKLIAYTKTLSKTGKNKLHRENNVVYFIVK